MDKENVSTRSQLYWNTLIRIPSQIIAFVISIFIARMLDPKDFGIMGIAMMLIGYSNQLTNFGLNEAIIQKKIYDKKILNSIFSLDLTISIILASLFFILSGFIADFFNTPECKEVIRILCPFFIITSFSGLPYAFLRRDMNFKALSLFDVSYTLFMNLITLALALNDFGYWALVYGQLIPLIFKAVLLCIKTRWFPKIYYNHSTMNGILNFGMWNFIKTQLAFISQHVDKFIIGRWLGASSLGFYDKAITMAETPYNSLTMSINGVMFSSFIRTNEDKYDLQQQFKKSLTLISFINFPIYMGLIVIAPHFVHVLLGNNWLPMIVPFQIVLIGLLIKSLSGITSALNISAGKYKEDTLRFLIALVVFAIGCYLFLQFNIVGVAISYSFYYFFLFFLWMNLSLKILDLFWKDIFLAILPGVFASLLMFIVANMLAHFIFSQYTLINMFLIVVISVLIYSLYFLLDDSHYVKEFKQLIWKDLIGLVNFKNKFMVIYGSKGISPKP